MANEGGVFVLKGEDDLVAMRPAQFATEDDFQRLLSDFPALLAGEQIDATAPRRWILVKREKAIPSEDGGAGRWSVDHLFIDQDAVPTLVEVKRQSDTRIRREVVGQMLDYAANSVVWWPVEEIRTEFERACADQGKDPTETLAQLIGPDREPSGFWDQVKTNLRAGKIRILFVADRIPAELRRIVEFLNQQMDPAEVLALELRQYEGEGLKTLVPIIYGQTEEARTKKGAGVRRPKRQWDAESLLADLQERVSADELEAARRIMAWITSNADDPCYGGGAKDGSLAAGFQHADEVVYPFFFWTYGRVEVAFAYLVRKPVFNDAKKRRELLSRLNAIPGISLSDGDLTKRPSIPLRTLCQGDRVERFIEVMEWTAREIRGEGP